MKRFVVTAIKAQVCCGVLQLDKDQAASRAYALKSLGDGLYLIEKPVEFKRGEEFGFDGEVSKATLQEMEPVEAADAKRAAKKADQGGAEKADQGGAEKADQGGAEKADQGGAKKADQGGAEKADQGA